jgi:signal peptidase I
MSETEKPKRRRGAPWWVWTLPGLLLVLLPTLNHFFLFQLFRQPSGSMQPTLHAGDMFAVSKWAYGYNQLSFHPFSSIAPEGHWFARAPQRGDIIVFEPEPEPGRFFIKRVIGLPGDRIQVIEGVVHINGEIVPREAAGEAVIEGYDGAEHVPAFRETLPNGVTYTVLDRNPRSELDNTRDYTVPEGHVFVMGDDRDNSADSRVMGLVGFVPMDHIIGRVDHTFADR